MKNKIILVAAIVCLVATISNAQKVGYLNTNELLLQMPEIKKADTILNTYADDMQKIYTEKVMKYQQALADYQKNASTWSEVKREYAEQELGDMQVSISDYEKSSNDKLEAKKEELYGPILDKVKAAIKVVGEQNKFTAILDGSALLYTGTDAVDILPLVKKQLGIQ